MVLFRNTQLRLRRNERVKRRIAPAPFSPVDRLLDRSREKIVRFGGNSEKPSSSYNAGIRFGSVKDEKKEKVR